MAQWQTILYEKQGNVVRVSLNRPEAHNPMTFQLIKELDEAAGQVEQDDDIRVMILAAKGQHFSIGHDLASREGVNAIAEAHRTPEHGYEQERKWFFDASLRIWNLPKPTIAQVQGKALLAGFTLANMCDLIVASHDAKFHNPVLRMGQVDEEVCIAPWVMNARQAKGFLFLGESIDAQEALGMGLVNRVVPRQDLERVTMELAQSISRRSPLAVQMCKRIINNSQEAMGMRQALEFAWMNHIFLHSTEASRQALRRTQEERGDLKSWYERMLAEG